MLNVTLDVTPEAPDSEALVWHGPDELRPLLVPIDSLTPLPGNPRRGDVEAVARSLERFGQRKNITRRPEGITTAGNHTRLAALSLGWTHLAVVTIDEDDASSLAWSLADNRASDLATNDDADLAAMLAEINAADASLMAAASYTDSDLAELLASLEPPFEAQSDPDEVPEPPKVPVTQPGDLWVLGEHRLLCGDATVAADLDSVYGVAVGAVLTDPPYGIGLDTDYAPILGSAKGDPGMRGRGRTYRPVAGDDTPFDAAPLVAYFAKVPEQFWFGADYYRRTLSPDDRDGSWLVWDKRSEQTDTVIGSGFELLWSKASHKRDLLRFYWCGAYGAVEARERMHPTQKPVALLTEILRRWTPPNCRVADPFLGSGSTLIACHNTGRSCYGLELDPHYCDVIVERWQNHTGGKAHRQ